MTLYRASLMQLTNNNKKRTRSIRGVVKMKRDDDSRTCTTKICHTRRTPFKLAIVMYKGYLCHRWYLSHMYNEPPGSSIRRRVCVCINNLYNVNIYNRFWFYSHPSFTRLCRFVVPFTLYNLVH